MLIDNLADCEVCAVIRFLDAKLFVTLKFITSLYKCTRIMPWMMETCISHKRYSMKEWPMSMTWTSLDGYCHDWRFDQKILGLYSWKQAIQYWWVTPVVSSRIIICHLWHCYWEASLQKDLCVMGTKKAQEKAYGPLCDVSGAVSQGSGVFESYCDQRWPGCHYKP